MSMHAAGLFTQVSFALFQFATQMSAKRIAAVRAIMSQSAAAIRRHEAALSSVIAKLVLVLRTNGQIWCCCTMPSPDDELCKCVRYSLRCLVLYDSDFCGWGVKKNRR